MTALCRVHDVRLGLITDGERWMLVNAPSGATSSDASWYARLWFQEPVTLKAFQSLLGVRRCFGPVDETLEALLDESLEHHEEITDTLGEQVRRAVEVLVQCLDKADADRNRELLRNVPPAVLYEAGLTVMMRLVFVLCAEERELLLLGDPVYDECYAISTLRSQLAEEADKYGPEVLDRRHDAWARLLSVFRTVHGGIDHETLRMPALGGSLFDPDRFPFLEGRLKGTSWRDSEATPLPIDNRTVLLLLNSLQLLEQHGGALLLSYRALDVEQIGHVYEGLLEHTVSRVPSVTVGLVGSKKAKNPNLPLSELESAGRDSEDTLVTLVMETIERSEPAVRNALTRPVEEDIFGRLLSVCGGDTVLSERIRPFANLLRTDAWGEPIVYRENAFMVTLGADRRETGTHYTPKSLTESIVERTLESVTYFGPAEGKPREEWKLKSPAELLDLKVCDPAMGSGAFLVQACRWLAERLVEAWAADESAGKFITADGEVRQVAGKSDPMPTGLDERLLVAKRLIAERCLYGVDVNPLAVELAKLSIWLVTMAKGRPFSFLDHNLRHGDSILGIYRLDQLTKLWLNPDNGPHQQRIFGQNVAAAVANAVEIRKRLRAIPIRDIRDVESIARLDCEARKKLQAVQFLADYMICEVLQAYGNARVIASALDSLAMQADALLDGKGDIGVAIAREVRKALSADLVEGRPPRKPLHWPLEFPEVFTRKNSGFDVAVGNPPFLGGKRISTVHGIMFERFLKIAFDRSKGAADLCAYFIRRAYSLLNESGNLGLITTNSVTEGPTRTVGLAAVVEDGGHIYNAQHGFKWPGTANVIASFVCISSGVDSRALLLNDEKVHFISTRLDELPELTPHRLVSNPISFSDGKYLSGDGFRIDQHERDDFLMEDERNASIIYPYLNSEIFNSSPTHQPIRWAIDFGVMDYDEASSYKGPFSRVEQQVKPYRESLSGQIHETRFWLYWDKREAFFSSIKEKDEVLICPRVAKYLLFDFYPPTWVFSDALKIFDVQSYGTFSILQSTLHLIWARQFSSSLKQDLRYSTNDAFQTFPFPINGEAFVELCEVGQKYYETRKNIMARNVEGLTDTYNRMHNPNENSRPFQEFRELHVSMDRAVLTAYQWADVSLEHDFYKTKQGIRFAISERARRTLLGRLLVFNQKLHDGELL
jgi:hypothetical protein